jgi:MFS family permease
VTVPAPVDRRIPVLGLALLATPTALSANSTATVVPDVARDLGVTVADATWTATAFGWAAVIGTPLAAALVRTRGPRFAVLVNAALVLLGTLLVWIAPGLPLLLAGRAAQAAGGGGLVTVAIALAGTARRTGVVTAGIGLVGALGPLAGSSFAALSWRLPMCLSLLALAAVPAVVRRLPARPERRAADPDHAGTLLVIGVVTALVLVPRAPVPASMTAAVLGVLLAARIRRRADGFVPRAVVRSGVFLRASAFACVLSTSYFALLYTVPRLLEVHWSAGPIGAGLLVALAAGSTASMLFAGVVPRGVLLAAGVTAPLLPLLTGWPPAILAATGFAVFAATGALAAYAVRVGRSVDETDRPAALGLFTILYQLGGAFGPALATVLVG